MVSDADLVYGLVRINPHIVAQREAIKTRRLTSD
jgi:hypothetical protein